ncbi:MAG: YgaP family membrane protein [Desulfitobacteriaceae bacterium]
MKKNAGGLDRFVRLIIGLIVLSLWFVLDGTTKYWALVGFIPLLTAVLGWCPLYPLIGINTLGKKK